MIITDIDEKYRDFKWDTSNPEKCVPIHRIHKFQPKLKGTEFGKVCRKHRLRDHRLISLVKHGVTSLAETRPYSVVLNFNYASLAQYYDQVFAKVQQELNKLFDGVRKLRIYTFLKFFIKKSFGGELELIGSGSIGGGFKNLT